MAQDPSSTRQSNAPTGSSCYRTFRCTRRRQARRPWRTTPTRCEYCKRRLPYEAGAHTFRIWQVLELLHARGGGHVVAVFAGHLHRGGCAPYSRPTHDLLTTYSRPTHDLLTTYSRLTHDLLTTYSRPTRDLRTSTCHRSRLTHDLRTSTCHRYAVDPRSVHHVTIRSPLNYADCFGHVDVYDDRPELQPSLQNHYEVVTTSVHNSTASATWK